MQKIRRHERVTLEADVSIRPGNNKSVRFACKAFNASKVGLAVFSEHLIAVGQLVGLELNLPAGGGAHRRITLFGVTR